MYPLGPGGPLAIPTGQRVVRFTEGVDAIARTSPLEQAGQVPLHATPRGWLRYPAGRPRRSPVVGNVEAGMIGHGSETPPLEPRRRQHRGFPVSTCISRIREEASLA